MPVFDFECKSCNTSSEVFVTSNSSTHLCIQCATPLVQKLNTSIKTSYVGWGGWTQKNLEQDAYQAKRSALMSKRQKERPVEKLVPNVGGLELDSWKDASKYAKEKGYLTDGYDKKASEEK